MVCLQESHGGTSSARTLMPELSVDAKVFSSCGASEATGGIVTIISNKYLHPNSVVQGHVLVRGRVHLITINFGGGQVCILNVHNFGFSAFEVRRVVNRMRRPISLAKSDPGKFGVMIAGDWNFLVPGDSPTLLSSGSRVVDFSSRGGPPL